MKHLITLITIGWLISTSYTHIHGEDDLLGVTVSYEVCPNIYLGIGGHVNYDIHNPFVVPTNNNWRESISVSLTIKI